MNANQPPRIAAWLLRHLATCPNIEAIVGDMDERYFHGRSHLWYWRQVAVAIVVSTFKGFRSHKLLAVRAVIVGWGVWSILALFSSKMQYVALTEFAMWRHPNVYPLLLTGLYAPCAVASGCLVAYLHTQSGRAMVLLYAVSWWSFHTVLLAQMAVTRFAFRIYLIPGEAELIGIRMGIDAALVIAIVVGGMVGDRQTSRQIGRIAGQPGAELHGAN